MINIKYRKFRQRRFSRVTFETLETVDVRTDRHYRIMSRTLLSRARHRWPLLQMAMLSIFVPKLSFSTLSFFSFGFVNNPISDTSNATDLRQIDTFPSELFESYPSSWENVNENKIYACERFEMKTSSNTSTLVNSPITRSVHLRPRLLFNLHTSVARYHVTRLPIDSPPTWIFIGRNSERQANSLTATRYALPSTIYTAPNYLYSLFR